MARERSSTPAAVRITTAGAAREVDIATRQRRYLISMTIRSVCFITGIMAALAGLSWLWPFLMLGAVFLPYLAVVLANAKDTRTDAFVIRDDIRHKELE